MSPFLGPFLSYATLTAIKSTVMEVFTAIPHHYRIILVSCLCTCIWFLRVKQKTSKINTSEWCLSSVCLWCFWKQNLISKIKSWFTVSEANHPSRNLLHPIFDANLNLLSWLPLTISCVLPSFQDSMVFNALNWCWNTIFYSWLSTLSRGQQKEVIPETHNISYLPREFKLLIPVPSF